MLSGALPLISDALGEPSFGRPMEKLLILDSNHLLDEPGYFHSKHRPFYGSEFAGLGGPGLGVSGDWESG